MVKKVVFTLVGNRVSRTIPFWGKQQITCEQTYVQYVRNSLQTTASFIVL